MTLLHSWPMSDRARLRSIASTAGRTNDGNYEPGNVRWATMKEQQNNRSSNTWITVGDKTMNIQQWADHLRTTAGAICERIWRGYTPEDAVSVPFYQGQGGEMNGNSKVTPKEVRNIRLMHKYGYPTKRLAVLFGMKKAGIYSIVSRQHWKSVA